LQNKLKFTSINDLLADYQYIPEHEDLQIVQSALHLSAYVLAQDPAQLGGQLAGRLLEIKSATIGAFVSQISQLADLPHLLPLTASLSAPGGALLRTLHQGLAPGGMAGVFSSPGKIALSSNGRYVFSSISSSKIKVWDSETGVVVRILEREAKDVSALAVAGDTKRIVSGSWKGEISVWDIDTGQKLLSFQGHQGRVSAFALRRTMKRYAFTYPSRAP
jgi:hypothetical protein